MASDFLALERTAQRLCDGLAGIVDAKTREELAQIRNVITTVRHAQQMLYGSNVRSRARCIEDMAVSLTLLKPEEVRGLLSEGVDHG